MLELPGELAMLFQQKSTEMLSVVVEIYNKGHEAGLAAGGGGGGFTQEQVDQMILEAVELKKVQLKESMKTLVDSHDADNQTDAQLKELIDQLN